MMLSRRPEHVFCTFCSKELDVLKRVPADWKRSEIHFCDEICHNAWNDQNGLYKEMSQKGGDVIRAYKQKHGKMPNHEARSEAITKNNIAMPPKAKHLQRTGKIWGWNAIFTPNGDDGYIAAIPDLEGYIKPMSVSTMKEGIKKLRDKFIELRLQERESGF